MTVFQISVVSDTVCPWCYVGKRQLEKGIAAYKADHPGASDQFNITWHPFYLNPDAPKKGVDKRQAYEAKFGPERTRMIHERLSSVGQELGINFKFGGRTGSTRDSHRLIELAKTKGSEVQSKVVDALFAGYFEKEEDITDPGMLKNAGLQAGLSGAELDDWLMSDKGGETVDRGVLDAMANIVTGVPNFTIGTFEVRGAQDARGFKQIFEKIRAMENR